MTYPSARARFVYRQCVQCNLEVKEILPIPVAPPGHCTGKLNILGATYGHPRDPSQCVDLTDELQALVRAQGGDQLVLGLDGMDLMESLEMSPPPDDPCPGVVPKALRLRCDMHGRRVEYSFLIDELSTRGRSPGRSPGRSGGRSGGMSPGMSPGMSAGGRKRVGGTPSSPGGKAKSGFGRSSSPTPGSSGGSGRGVGSQRGARSGARSPGGSRGSPPGSPGSPGSPGGGRKGRSRRRRLALREPLIITPPPEPWLVVLSAIFGHPHDERLQFDVAERLQARIDGVEGRFLYIEKGEDIFEWLNDPCTGVHKDFTINYEIRGWRGELTVEEAHGFLLHPIRIVAPTTRPQMMIKAATLGVVMPKRGKERKEDKPRFDPDYFVELGAELREEVDTSGYGVRLVIPAGTDICARYRVPDPKRGMPKLLYIEYESRGKNHKIRVPVDAKGVAGTLDPIELLPTSMEQGRDQSTRDRDRNRMVAPRISIVAASYGNPASPMTHRCVRGTLQSFVDANPYGNLEIGCDEDLESLFGVSPCPGTYAALTIRYEMCGWMQSVVVGLEGGGPHLEGTIGIGWPDATPVFPLPEPQEGVEAGNMNVEPVSVRHRCDYYHRYNTLGEPLSGPLHNDSLDKPVFK